MIALIALSSLMVVYSYDITQGAMCSCYSITYQPDCLFMNNYCNWQGNACVEYNCSTITTYNTCVTANKCAWVNNTCSQFTKCSDYIPNSNSSCDIQGSGCTQFVNGVNCVDIISNSTGPAPCSVYTTNASCAEGYRCKWNGAQCRATVCSDYNTSSSCFIALSADWTTVKTCQWSSSCSDSGTVNFNSTTCIQYSKMMYTWNTETNSCQSCATNSLVLAISLFSILVI